MSEILVNVEGLSKKFSKDLKHSIFYGVQDIMRGTLGFTPKTFRLRATEFWALDNISLELKRGECLALIGPNGSGKSTLLKILNGIIAPDKGKVTIDGRVGALIELGAGFHPLLTGRENIYVNGSILGFKKREIDRKFDEIVNFSEIEEFIDTPIKNYSTGMRVRLGFAIAAHLNPDILLIDEVLAVGDVGFRMKCFKHFISLIENGTSIIIVSHAINHLSRVTNRALVINKGKTIYNGELNKGIITYQDIMLSEKVNQTEENNNKKNAYIKSVSLSDVSGNEKVEFNTNDTICVTITISSNKKIISPRLIVSIESPILGLLGSFSTSYTNYKFNVEPPCSTMKLFIKKVPLLFGSYSINLSLYGPEITDFYDRKLGAASFTIVAPPTNAFGYGISDIVYFNHCWELYTTPE